MADVFYRAEIASGSDEVTFREYRVVRRTPSGAWLNEHGWSDDSDPKNLRWCDRFGRFACEDKEHALDRLKARTRSYLRHSRKHHEEAKRRCAILGLSTTPVRGRLIGWSGFDY